MHNSITPADRVTESLKKLDESKTMLNKTMAVAGRDLSLLAILEKVIFFENQIKAFSEKTIIENNALDDNATKELDRMQTAINGINDVTTDMAKKLSSIGIELS